MSVTGALKHFFNHLHKILKLRDATDICNDLTIPPESKISETLKHQSFFKTSSLKSQRLTNTKVSQKSTISETLTQELLKHKSFSNKELLKLDKPKRGFSNVKLWGAPLPRPALLVDKKLSPLALEGK